MKIYTKTGDSGQTSLIGGTRVDKNHIRIEAYGTIDELNSWIGLLATVRTEENLVQSLKAVQDVLFTIGSNLASDPEKSKMKLPEIRESQVAELEAEMDEMDNQLPALANFILPGGHTHNAWAHIARCVCRRAERQTVSLSLHAPVESIIIRYLNRLSDYLFVLARYITWVEKSQEIVWKPEKKG